MGASAFRTYVVFLGPTVAGMRALGTVRAHTRHIARRAAEARWHEVDRSCLRLVTASSAPGRLLIEALANDGDWINARRP